MKLLSTKQAFSKKFKTFKLPKKWSDILGEPETTGAWIIYGKEKHGKTTFALMLAKVLAEIENTIYESAEEGISKNIIETAKRVGIDHNSRIKWLEYESFEDFQIRLGKRTCPKIIFFDNWTVYNDEMTKKQILELLEKHKNKLFIFLAHEDRKEPDGAKAKLWKKLSKVIVHIDGLKAYVSGRCPGGIIDIDTEKANIYHGTEIQENND